MHSNKYGTQHKITSLIYNNHAKCKKCNALIKPTMMTLPASVEKSPKYAGNFPQNVWQIIALCTKIDWNQFLLGIPCTDYR